MKKTEINYPTQEWLDNWIDKYIDKNPNEKITDFKALEEKATEEWWDNEIDHNRPTPFDLTPEQQKVAKEATKTGTRKTTTNYKFDKKKRPKDAGHFAYSWFSDWSRQWYTVLCPRRRKPD